MSNQRVHWLHTILLIGALSLASCRGGDPNPDTPDASNPNDPDAAVPPGDDDTIQSVQADTMPAGTPVILREVVVVAVDTFGARTGSVYVSEPEGGPFSGVVVFTATGGAGLQPGDVINVEGGVKDEFALTSDMSGRTLTQIVAPDGGQLVLTKVGDGVVPAPSVVDPAVLAASDIEAEQWEGVLIKFENAPVEVGPFAVTATDPTLKEMFLQGPFRVSSTLTALSDDTVRNTCFTEIVGIGDYFFNYKILPRSAADLVAGAGCDVLANHTVVSVQDDTIPLGTLVGTESAVVTAIDQERKHLWIQDESVIAAHNGIFLFRGSGAVALREEIVVGARVNVSGIASDFNGATQLASVNVSFLNGGATVAIIDGVDPAIVGDIVTGSPFESTLLRFPNVTIQNINPDAPSEFGRFTVSTGGNPLVVDDQLDFALKMDLGLTAGQCLSSLTGVVVLNTFDDVYFVAPRGPGDVNLTPCP